MATLEPNNDVIIYAGADGAPRLEVQLQDETVWLSQTQLVELFDSSKSNISEHIKHIFAEGELAAEAVVRNFRTTASDGKSYAVDHYNLDMIISLGYRVRSQVATHFRQWATARLREYIVKGFTIDDERLKQAGGGGYWKELLDAIKDIRSSEKVLYRQVLDLYATSTDYDKDSALSQQFFATIQNKLHYAVNGKTAAELISERVDAQQQFMGLMTFGPNGVTKQDVTVAKNYLNETEIKRLNNIVSAYFDIAELRALDQKPTTMQDYLDQLDKLIVSIDRTVLQNAGSVSKIEADKKAHEEYIAYKNKTLSDVESAYLENMKSLQQTVTNKLKRDTK